MKPATSSLAGDALSEDPPHHHHSSGGGQHNKEKQKRARQKARIQALTSCPREQVEPPITTTTTSTLQVSTERRLVLGSTSSPPPPPPRVPPPQQRPGKKRLRQMRYQQRSLSTHDYLCSTAQQATFTQSVAAPSSIAGPSSAAGPLPQDSTAGLTSRGVEMETPLPTAVTVLTSSDPLSTTVDTGHLPAHGSWPNQRFIRIQPLLVLDLNGILCHRIRPVAPNVTADPDQEHFPRQRPYRPAVARIAMTPIIPRPHLPDWLYRLDRHFCLAIWTSAKAKTATQLIRALIPPDLAQRFLFVWAQHHCRRRRVDTAVLSSDPDNNSNSSSSVDGAGQNDIWEKDLADVWKAYPLWNASNTLLVDDSPNKCTQWEDNAVHPPRLNGRVARPPGHHHRHQVKAGLDDDDEDDEMDDEVNCERQNAFFSQLIQHWSKHPLIQVWPPAPDPASSDPAGEAARPLLPPHSHTVQSQYDFLLENAVGHMGWSRNR